MGKRAGVALLVCTLGSACKSRPPEGPSESQPQQSIFCSTAYPYGIAQEDPASPPVLYVSVGAGGFETHWGIGFSEAAASLSSGTTLRSVDEDSETLPHLIIETLDNEEAPHQVNVTVSGRETIRMGPPPDGGADTRILFTFSTGQSYEDLTEAHEDAAAHVYLHVVAGWTCNGDFSVPTRSL